MARQFQGYARGRGFSSRSPGAGAVSRIQEQGDKTIQGLKEQLQSKRQQDQRYASDLDTNFQRGEKIKGEIKRFDDKAFDLKMSNIKQNQQQSIDNIKTEAANQSRMYEQLSEFSTTLGESIVEVKDAVEEAKKKAAFSTIELDLANPPSATDKAAEEILRKGDVISANSLKKSVTEDGLAISTAQTAISKTPYKHLKNLDARIEAATRELVATAGLNNHGPEFIHGILEKYNLYGVRPSRLYGLAQQYSKIKSGYIQAQNIKDAISTSTQTLNTVKANYLKNPTKENRFHLISTLSFHTTDGKTYITREEQNNILYEIHENEAISDQVRQEFFSSPLLDVNGDPMDRTYGEQFKDTRNVELLNNVEKKRIESVTQRNNVIKAEQKQNYLDTLEAVDQLGEVDDPAPYIAELDDVDLSKEQRNILSEKLTDLSKYGKEQKNVDRQLQYAHDNGQPMDQIFLQAKGKTRNKWKSVVAEVKNGMQAAGVSDTENRKRLLKQGKLRLNVQSIDKINDTSLDYATDDRIANVQKRRQELMRINQMDYASANKQAMAEELDLIEKSNLPEYKPEGAATGIFSTHNFYSHYSPGGGYFTNVVQANKHQALLAVRARPDSIKDVLLAPTSYFASVYDSIQNNKPIPESSLFNELHKFNPEALQLQLNLYTTEKGLSPATVPLTQNQYLAANAEDPRLKQFALRMDTIQEIRIFPLAADKATQMGIQVMSPGVQAAYQNMATTAFDTGAVIGDISIDGARRAIIGKESTNNFREENPHSGALGFAQVMPENVGPWSQEILGRTVSQQEFLNNPSVQMAIINGKLEKYFQQEAAKGFTGDVLLRRVASMWYSGKADLYDKAADEYYKGHKYPSIRSYTKDIAKRYRSGQ